MRALNPFEPSGGIAGSETDGVNTERRLGLFFATHFLTFVSTFMTLAIAISCYRSGISLALIFSFGRLVRFAGLTVILWLPHSFVAMRSFPVSPEGARLCGVVGATVLAFGVYATEWILRNWLPAFSYVGHLSLALSMLLSLAVVATLGHFRRNNVP
jgi:hypothetical protein